MHPTRAVQKICGVIALCLSMGGVGFATVDNKNVALGAWVNDTQFEFHCRENYQNSLLLNDQNNPPKNSGPFQLLEKNSFFQSLREKGDAILERLDLQKGNTDKRWIIPIFSAEKRDKMQQPRPYDSGNSSFSGKVNGNKRDNKSERYLIGYRLNRVERSQPGWMIGLGFKKGGRDSQAGRDDNTASEQSQSGILASLNNSAGENRAKKQDFRGPIVGLVGEF